MCNSLTTTGVSIVVIILSIIKKYPSQSSCNYYYLVEYYRMCTHMNKSLIETSKEPLRKNKERSSYGEHI